MNEEKAKQLINDSYPLLTEGINELDIVVVDGFETAYKEAMLEQVKTAIRRQLAWPVRDN